MATKKPISPLKGITTWIKNQKSKKEEIDKKKYHSGSVSWNKIEDKTPSKILRAQIKECKNFNFKRKSSSNFYEKML